MFGLTFERVIYITLHMFVCAYYSTYIKFLGGTLEKRGRNKGYTDRTHIIGQAIRLNTNCAPVMLCSNRLFRPWNMTSPSPLGIFIFPTSAVDQNTHIIPSHMCYTAPFVRCNDSDPWTPIWNLHVHSKNTQDFRSQPCNCSQ